MSKTIYLKYVQFVLGYYVSVKTSSNTARFGSTFTKIRAIRRRLARLPCKDDMQIHEALHMFFRKKDFK